MTDKTENAAAEEQNDVGRDNRKNHLMNVLTDMMKTVNQGEPGTNVPASAVFSVIFFEDGNNQVLLAGEYNHIMLKGTLMEFMLNLTEQRVLNQVDKNIEIAIAEAEMEEEGGTAKLN